MIPRIGIENFGLHSDYGTRVEQQENDVLHNMHNIIMLETNGKLFSGFFLLKKNPFYELKFRSRQQVHSWISQIQYYV